MIALAVGGVVLSGAFRQAVEDNFDANLQTDMDGLIAAAEPDPNGGVVLQERFLSSRFDRVYSGLYFEIRPEDSKFGPPQVSHSLFDKTLQINEKHDTGREVWGFSPGPDNQHLRVIARHVEFPISATPSPNDSRAYDFFVAGDLSEVDAESSKFNGTLIWSFIILGLGLVAAVFIQVRVGLQPLRRVSNALARIRDGSARRLEGKFPAEIAPLATELNSLIQHSEEVVGRARTHVSNLAHFLKTPLSVLSSEASAQPGPLADAVQRQVGSMRRQVDHYLVRARAAGALDVLGNRTQVSPVLEDLARVLRRIHSARSIEIAVIAPEELYFRGERQDFEEMAGNLMDNGCKWADRRVRATARRMGPHFHLLIEDDGPGLTIEERSQVGGRGERLDESVPGTGLGLAIVRDIAKLYGGELDLGTSGLGGLEARLVLPAIA